MHEAAGSWSDAGGDRIDVLLLSPEQVVRIASEAHETDGGHSSDLLFPDGFHRFNIPLIY
jgi:hypothetical protein